MIAPQKAPLVPLMRILFAKRARLPVTARHPQDSERGAVWRLSGGGGYPPPTPPTLYSNRPCIVTRGTRGTSLSVLQGYSEGSILSFSCAFAGWPGSYYWCITVYFRFLDPRHSPFQPWMLIVFTCTHLVLLPILNVPGSGAGSSSDASQDATKSDFSLLTSVESGLPSGVEDDSDDASDTEIVWARSARGVWGLANVFANGKLYFMRDVPEATCLPQGLEPPAKPATKPAPKAAKPCAKPSTRSAAKPAARVAATPTTKPAAEEPIPMAPVVHVQLFTVELNMHPNMQFPGQFEVHMPSCLHVLCRVARPLQGTVTWGMFPQGCKDTVACRWLLYKGGGVGMERCMLSARIPSQYGPVEIVRTCLGCLRRIFHCFVWPGVISISASKLLPLHFMILVSYG